MQGGKWKKRLIFGGGLLACLLVALASLCLGNIHFSPVQLFRLFFGSGDRIAKSILLYARLPRTL
ncbi:MAG: hypothetical protein K2O03_13875, partial [Lachnospiraceae bacterium]|nr:hypothetical protein [Lachnospiraceae bacterium]